MPSQSKGNSSKTVIEQPATINWPWTENSQEGSSLILSIVKEAAILSPIAELKKAACSALLIFKTTQIIKKNKGAYERLGYDSGGLIVTIWYSVKKAEDPEEWLSAEMRDILESLSQTLENICSFVNGELSKRKGIRVLFSSRDNGVKINEYRERLNYALERFELQSLKDVLVRVLKKSDEQISKLEQLKQVEINLETEDERWRSDELKKIEKETKDRKSELERLRAASRELEKANRLMKAEEEEIAQLKRELAAKENNRRFNKIQARSSEKQSSRQEDRVYEEDDEEWEEISVVSSSSEEELERPASVPVRRSSKAKRNASVSASRRFVPVDFTDDEEQDLQCLRSSRSRLRASCRRLSSASFPEEQEEDLQSLGSSRLKASRRKLSSASLPEEDFMPVSMRSAKARMARRNLSSASIRVQDTENDYTDTDEEYNYYAPSPPRKSPRAKCKPQTSSGNVDDLMAQFQGSTPRNAIGSNSHSGSSMYMVTVINSNSYFPTYGGSSSQAFSPPIAPYGYGVGTMPGLPVVVNLNSSAENMINSSKSNVGNDNSAKTVYGPRTSQRRS